jgi:hypothetical protein
MTQKAETVIVWSFKKRILEGNMKKCGIFLHTTVIFLFEINIEAIMP